MALALPSCNTLPKFPTKNVFEVDLQNNVCGMYEITDFERLLFKHVKDLPIESCQGVFGFSANKIGPVMNWSRDVIQKYKDKCK